MQEAVGLLRKGDAASVDRALALLQRTVLSFGIKVCGHREDAEDTAQEVLLKSLPYLSRLEDAQALSAFLYTAAKNRCWQGRRTASYQRTIALDQLLPDRAELQALLLTDRAGNPEDTASRRQDHRLLHEAVLTLPPQYRMVLVLHDMEELDTELIANILGLRPGTVRVRLHRARLLVRQAIANRRKGIRFVRRRRAPGRSSAECREIFANLSEYLDGRQAPEDCERMRQHLESCAACVAFIQDLKRAIDRCRSLDVCPGQDAGPTLRRMLTEEYLRLKNSSVDL